MDTFGGRIFVLCWEVVPILEVLDRHSPQLWGCTVAVRVVVYKNLNQRPHADTLNGHISTELCIHLLVLLTSQLAIHRNFDAGLTFSTQGFDLYMSTLGYFVELLRGTLSVRCLEIGGYPSLGGWKCIISMANSIGGMLFVLCMEAVHICYGRFHCSCLFTKYKGHNG